MRIGILTSWRVPCGVYQYSARFADALAEIGHEPVILAGRADEHRSVPEESEHEVHDTTTIGMWSDDGQYSIIKGIVNLNLDAIHVQYQSMLFTQPILMTLLRDTNCPLAVTFHDKCQHPSFPYRIFDLKFSHRWDVGPNNVEVIPFGIEDKPPVIRTFGLGRSRFDFIQGICSRNGWVAESTASHEPIFGGGQAWMPHEELLNWLRGADAIVLWYGEEPMAGSSQAARTALAARRQVFTNDTTWFEDLPANTRDYTKVSTLEELEHELQNEFKRPYVDEYSWTNVAKHLIGRYQSAARLAV